MARKKEKAYINGKFVATKYHMPVVDPYTGREFAEYPVCDDGCLDEAMDAAVKAEKGFASLARDERSGMLHRMVEGLGKHGEEIAQLIRREGGKPITFARGEVSRARVTCKFAGEEAVRFGGEWLPLDIHPGARNFSALVGRVPIGSTLAISPFNFPLNLIMHKLAPAIAVGCPVIIKPSSDTPLTALRLAKICHDAGVPAGAVQVVPCPGPIFERLVRDERPKMLSFTGSAEVGWGLKSVAGRKRVALELGGNAGVLVHEDADLKFAAQRVAYGGFVHAGQVCIGVQRVFVHEPVWDEFMKLLVKETRKVKAGDPSEEDVMIGPMINAGEVDRVESWIDEAVSSGAKAVVRGKRKMNVLGPTVLTDVPKNVKVMAKEVFGPVICVVPYKRWEDGLKKLNDTVYGLQAGIFTRDIGRIMEAYREIEVGAVVANDVPTVRVDNYPYGGVKESGRGREGVGCTMREMTEERVLVLRI